MTETDPQNVMARIVWPLRLTWAGLWAERISRAFWPVWTLLLVALAGLSFGLHDKMPLEAVWVLAVVVILGSLVALWRGWQAFHKPTRVEALARLDAALPGRPLAALTDDQVIGRGDAASVAVWRAHRERMAQVAAGAKPIAPDLRLSSRDPFGLRYMALTVLVVGLLFGSIWRVASITGLTPGPAIAGVAGPSWEGWAEPPAHTGKPPLYLNDIPEGKLEVPTGTHIQVRLYGNPGDLTLSETVSARLKPAPASDPEQEFDVLQSGEIRISGSSGRVWQVVALPDGKPSVEITGEAKREKDGQMKLPFKAADDYGVVSGQATITLDMGALDRRFGLTVDPEPREPLILDLPMPISGSRTAFEENLIDDISKHPYANLPVNVSLTVTDAMGQVGQSAPMNITLPGKRFFDPLAAALIEMRRDLLWNRLNAERSNEILKAVTNRPDDLIRNEKAGLRLRVLMRKLDAEAATLTAESRDKMADELWEIALMVETGDLQSAKERLDRAQDRLDEAIKRGADPSEIEELTQELREAMDEYMSQLAQEQQRNPSENMGEAQQSQEITNDQIQQMLDELQKLLEEGRMAEAQELMEALKDLMANIQMTQGNGKGGPKGPGEKSMDDLRDSLRDQQDLSDDSFDELQNGPRDEQDGQQGQESGRPGDQNGKGQDGRSLAERQKDLRDRMNGLRDENLPGQGSKKGDEGRQALKDAGRAMDKAEEALREGDLSGALDRQAEAMEALRNGLRNLGEALAEDQRDKQPDAEGGNVETAQNDQVARDPLGREMGDAARIGSDENLMQGEDVYRRAQDLLDEIRRRTGDQTRPEAERDYLERLLDLF